MRIAVCDDSFVNIEAIDTLLKNYCNSRPHLKTDISFFTGANELLSGEYNFDCYLLDVLMNKMNGIELARELRNRGVKGQIIFLTSSKDYALPAFSVRALGYLLKPIEQTALFELLDDAVKQINVLQKSPPYTFSFRIPGKLYTIPVDDILYVEISGHTPIIHLTGKVIKGSDLRITFEEYAAPLIESGKFLRTHRSFLVNIEHIATVTQSDVYLNSGDIIPIARRRSSEVKVQYMDYLAAGGGV